jgi:hypothetical protein
MALAPNILAFIQNLLESDISSGDMLGGLIVLCVPFPD